jgi:hypothetical protein
VGRSMHFTAIHCLTAGVLCPTGCPLFLTTGCPLLLHPPFTRRCQSLRRLYIGHSTGALSRMPAPVPALGYIDAAGSRSTRFSYPGAPPSSSSGVNGSSASGGPSSVWCAATQAAASRPAGLPRLSIVCRNPSSESGFERRTLFRLLRCGEDDCAVPQGRSLTMLW